MTGAIPQRAPIHRSLSFLCTMDNVPRISNHPLGTPLLDLGAIHPGFSGAMHFRRNDPRRVFTQPKVLNPGNSGEPQTKSFPRHAVTLTRWLGPLWDQRVSFVPHPRGPDQSTFNNTMHFFKIPVQGLLTKAVQTCRQIRGPTCCTKVGR